VVNLLLLAQTKANGLEIMKAGYSTESSLKRMTDQRAIKVKLLGDPTCGSNSPFPRQSFTIISFLYGTSLETIYKKKLMLPHDRKCHRCKEHRESHDKPDTKQNIHRNTYVCVEGFCTVAR